MLYGAIATLGMAIGLGKPLAFDFSWPYVSSLAYLVVFGSVAAFGAYLALLHRAGPEKAAFASLVFPIVALTISTVFENYQWSVEAVLGVALILGGNRWHLKPSFLVGCPSTDSHSRCNANSWAKGSAVFLHCHRLGCCGGRFNFTGYLDGFVGFLAIATATSRHNVIPASAAAFGAGITWSKVRSWRESGFGSTGR